MPFQVDAKTHRVEVDEALVLLPARLRVPMPCPQLPQLVLDTIKAIQVGQRGGVGDGQRLGVWRYRAEGGGGGVGQSLCVWRMGRG